MAEYQNECNSRSKKTSEVSADVTSVKNIFLNTHYTHKEDFFGNIGIHCKNAPALHRQTVVFSPFRLLSNVPFSILFHDALCKTHPFIQLLHNQGRILITDIL